MPQPIAEIDPGRDRARRVRRIMGRCLRAAIEQHGSELAGFAMVSWDMRGSAHSCYMTEVGPVAESLMPSYTKDALNRHVALKLTQETTSDLIDGA